jgi:hypothetical protein
MAKLVFGMNQSLDGYVYHDAFAPDHAALYQAASDPLIWEQHPDSDRYKEEEEEEVFKGYFDIAIESGGALVVLDALTHEIIGSSRYYGLDESLALPTLIQGHDWRPVAVICCHPSVTFVCRIA